MRIQKPHPRADEYLELRAQGKTCREIAELYGVTTQAVSQVIAQNGTGIGFRAFNETACIYPNLRRWLNENKVSRQQLARLIGLVSYHYSANRVAGWLKGETDPPKWAIDKLLQLTGLTYEKLFHQEKTEEDKNQ